METCCSYLIILTVIINGSGTASMLQYFKLRQSDADEAELVAASPAAGSRQGNGAAAATSPVSPRGAASPAALRDSASSMAAPEPVKVLAVSSCSDGSSGNGSSVQRLGWYGRCMFALRSFDVERSLAPLTRFLDRVGLPACQPASVTAVGACVPWSWSMHHAA